ncbi:hypothetical protein DL991_10465 [Amycolatopsis sp. WAC 01375]|uniref:hypothetical protein n=1 Tax=Amycolatopsis sp. WAC 01375 TaxID=2203194 RepID=UPI000F76FF54|nr:hypothetical protein [Amycolatopsis sp. WAC 01375]RSM80532.1 hypothetical protein DL991_10465 [Amycolatopsis sp. WAC 01375]
MGQQHEIMVLPMQDGMRASRYRTDAQKQTGVFGTGIASIFTTVRAQGSLTHELRMDHATSQTRRPLGAPWSRTTTESTSHSTNWKQRP